jgi:hypothetical protein
VRSYAFSVLRSLVPITIEPRIGEPYEPREVWPTAIRVLRDDGFTMIRVIDPAILDDIPYGPMGLAEECDRRAEAMA